MNKISALFGSMVFNDAIMREKLPNDTYKALQSHIDQGTPLSMETANVIASAMKDWALEHGATHFTHWFQPMTGITAEKHDSFISPTAGGGIVMNFSGKELIKGEPDASSFPSGGIRATFEARGYTNWDPSSYAFIKENTLCIPTAFCSYGGEALDKKTPLLRSMEAIEKQALRVLHLLGKESVRRITTTVGPEQEYFLVSKELYEKRKDLIYCGRTLLGAKPPKRQELEDHYFGAIKPKVNDFMEELDQELWKLGVLANTEHNEVAPAQHELAPIFASANVAADHNQLTMEMMKKVAGKHGLVCLLHEKPFAGINGSGKHINWSLATDSGENLLKPGKKPIENISFLLFLSAVIQAVDQYQDLLRVSVASPSNDHRLGGNEAPPAIISIFLGDDLLEVLEAVQEGKTEVPPKNRQMGIGVQVLPDFKKDTTDRNRTSPFAFTGGRFEFRMPGSTTSVSCPTYMINTIVADALMNIADKLEGSSNIEHDALNLVRDIYQNHKRIIFNGNNYSEEWVTEAERRGLLHLKSAMDACPHFTDQKNLDLFERQHVLTPVEAMARQEILYDEYCKLINIEALTMLDMVNKDILPAVLIYVKDLSEVVQSKQAISEDVPYEMEKNLIQSLSAACDSLYKKAITLDQHLLEVSSMEDTREAAEYFCQTIIPVMKEMRVVTDELETITAAKYWPMPTYGSLLFS
ncbi:glutamine synthetase type III [Aminipila butyrica]|uniref:Glutamine synthetase type III n=1 Tax=Aminipila butyrica TaxID=433296 RepID=A0A858BYX7_9FIRM|nr:glutamine synthetase III [Aminipila butyrica]QIB69894.1 glutamine synthetase type III [Aminipila butyrica]